MFKKRVVLWDQASNTKAALNGSETIADSGSITCIDVKAAIGACRTISTRVHHSPLAEGVLKKKSLKIFNFLCRCDLMSNLNNFINYFLILYDLFKQFKISCEISCELLFLFFILVLYRKIATPCASRWNFVQVMVLKIIILQYFYMLF